MKKLSLFLLAAITLTACSVAEQGPDKSPEEMVKEAAMNSYDFLSGSFEANINGEVENSLEEQSFSLDADISGAYDVREVESPKLAMAMDLTGSMDDGADQAVNFELRLFDNKIYAVLNNITDFEGQIPLPLVQGFFGKWWFIPLEGSGFQTDTLTSFYKDPNDPKTQAIKDLYMEHLMFKDLKYEGSKNVEGTDTYVYSWTLDKEETVAYLRAVGELNGQKLDESELAEAQTFLASIEVNGKMYIDQTEIVVVRVEGQFELMEIQGVSGNFDFSYGLSDLNQDVDVSAPDEATEFNPSAFLGGALPEGEGLPVDVDVNVEPVQ